MYKKINPFGWAAFCIETIYTIDVIELNASVLHAQAHFSHPAADNGLSGRFQIINIKFTTSDAPSSTD
jgi:hypothetical protein